MPSADSILVYKNIGYSYSWSNSSPEHSIARQFLESLVGKRAFIYSIERFPCKHARMRAKTFIQLFSVWLLINKILI